MPAPRPPQPATVARADALDTLREAVAWAEGTDRTTLVARGADAVRFLDGFTTAALGRLAVGAGGEGFLTDQRGWVIALVTFLREAEGLRIDAAPGLGQRLVEHLEHYHIREDVLLADVSPTVATSLVIGPHAASWLAREVAGPVPDVVHGHRAVQVGGHDALLIHTDWYGVPAFRVQVPVEVAAALRAWLVASGLPEVTTAALDAARIEAGSPEPVDIPEKTLPQELGRDARAISFTKGCYLGQETVARIDALGHVNRQLVVLACDAAVAAGMPIRRGDTGETVGAVTSAARAMRHEGMLALGLVHARGREPSAALEIGGAAARVVPCAGGRPDDA